MIRSKLSKRVLAALMAMVILLANLPAVGIMTSAATPESNYNRVVDKNTMDDWKNYFSLTDITTENAGGVWTDKSVFTDGSAFDGLITMKDGDKNFLTALSAIAANKEVVGYSTVPTDTIFVLDLSNSMSSAAVEDLIDATNAAIAQLNEVNNNNRIGVVLYSGSSSNRTYNNAVSRLMPLGRYAAASNGNYISYEDGEVDVLGEVKRANPSVDFNAKTHGGATYIQAGLWEAYEMFNAVEDIKIGDNNWQSGEYRMPILVLMSDGAPTLGTTYYDDVTASTYGNANQNATKADVGNGNDTNITAGQGFLVQLTASYIKNRIENKYQVKSENGAGRSLFYTLGFNINAIETQNARNVALSVLDPDSTTITDSLWQTYKSTGTTMQVRTKSRDTYSNNSYSNFTINKSSYVTGKSYVDEYFQASDDGLQNAFNTLVDEILIQSRYYPTHLEGGSPDFSGYVEFTDTIGEYMEIKDIKGILLGDTLFDGHMMASKLADTTEDGLGTVENPTALGDEFIRAVKTRLGIADTAEAQALVAQAFAAGQLKYNSATDWSNYIGWYAKADGTFAGFYNEGTTTAPADAVYINKSYGFLGETHGSIKNSDMMYMSVQVHTNISTAEQTLIWKIPAALVPLITYAVSLEGTNVDTAKNVEVTVENASAVAPIRLVYESGLRSDLNEFNITRITEEKHIAQNGVTRKFWTNYFDISAPDHEDHVTTFSEFTPSKENERFYYTFDSAVHKKVGSTYQLVSASEGVNGELDATKEYYHRRYIFTDDSSEPIFTYEKMSAKSIEAAHWDDSFETLDHTTGAWVVPKGTPARELSMYSADKDNNTTESAHMIFYPYLTEHNNVFYVDMNLGNNGLLSVTPAQGIKVTKTIDIYEQGTSDAFRFRITAQNENGAALAGSFDVYTTDMDAVPQGEPTTATFQNGVLEFDLTAGKSFWVVGIPAGATYVVEEISDNADYKLKSVHVNGVATGATATGAVAAYLMEDVAFVNTAVGEGDLVIAKQVVDENGQPVQVNQNIQFTAEVTLTNAAGAPISGSFESSKGTLTVPASGKFTVTLKAGESFVVRGLTEGTGYVVRETNIPAGFRLDTARSNLTGVVDAAANDQALIVNTYRPTSANGADIDVTVNKVIEGNRTNWLAGESYTFVLERNGNALDTKTITASDANKTAQFSLAGETYTEPGTYTYRIYEQKGTQGGITYDSTDRRFSVTVADSDMDGDLEVTAVTNLTGTTVTGSYHVSATFTNVYAPTGSVSVTINVVKRMNGNHRLDGYRFALYDVDPTGNQEANVVARSTVTNSAGNASITLNYTADFATAAGREFKYYLAEINMGDPNISYDTRVYPVTVTVYDDGDGTVSANLNVENVPAGETGPVFVNTYVPSDSDHVTISGTKEISGDRILNRGEFFFTITADTAGAPMPAVTKVSNEADGSFTFGAIEFTDAHKGQSFVYTIAEDRTNQLGGFNYDSAIYKVEVNVVDNGNATLTAVTEIKKEGTPVSDIRFVNAYDAVDAEITISGTKLLTGKTLEKDEFTFKLEAVTPGAPMPTANTAKNDANGAFAFGKITYAKAGTYVYEVTEVANGDTRYDFDKSVYTVTVTVTDDSVGHLWADVSLAKNDMASSEIVFRNGFTPTPVSYDLHAEFGGDKILNGRPIQAEEFRFVLMNAINGQQIGEAVANDANGKFRFPEVNLPAPGIYHYKITEAVGDESGVSYDTSSFHIRLEVAQKTDGTLEIIDEQLHKGIVSKQEVGGVLTEVTTYENITENGTIRFVNTYAAAPVSIQINATKEYKGAALTDGLFSFQLFDAEGKLIETVTNQGEKVAFSPLTVDMAGTYVYTVKEKVGTVEHVIYDDTVFTVTVKVTDNLDGTFAVEYSYETDTGKVEAINFVNTYDEPEDPPENEEIPEKDDKPEKEDKPNKNNVPKTGDDSRFFLWLTLLFVSGGAVLGLLATDRKKKEIQ